MRREPPAILDRAALDKRGRRVALSLGDRYVGVRARNEEEMILMRLSEAIRKTTPTRGLRIHGMRGVAPDQITAARGARRLTG